MFIYLKDNSRVRVSGITNKIPINLIDVDKQLKYFNKIKKDSQHLYKYLSNLFTQITDEWLNDDFINEYDIIDLAKEFDNLKLN